ncbi:MAG: vitamin B12 dependent-methionine synthase activation domain-containing protein [Bacteroidales bacterium]|nr:vitamin B12 dependent-methionine synthase activation domain-containing protein [Bacteroidales bacterium]
MKLTYTIPTLTPYVDWSYFYFAWGVKADQPEAAEIRAEGERLMHHLSLNGVVARAALEIYDAYSDGDDIVLTKPEAYRLSFLRQQHTRPDTPCLCLSDFIAPQGYADADHVADRIGLFATTVSASHECPCCTGDPLLMQTVKDRLAEAAAELLNRDFPGIRPAVGYPSLPDQSFIFDLAHLLPFDELGIHLTENGMMQPHASTCGLIFAHPAARYFSVGPVADDQLADYARRRGTSSERLRKFLPKH